MDDVRDIIKQCRRLIQRCLMAKPVLTPELRNLVQAVEALEQAVNDIEADGVVEQAKVVYSKDPFRQRVIEDLIRTRVIVSEQDRTRV